MKTLIAARSLWAAFLLTGGAGLVLSALNSSPAVIPEAGLGIVLMGFATVGATIASRRPRNPVGWLFLAFALGPAVYELARQYGTYALITHPGSLPGGVWMAWLSTWVTVPTFGAGATLLLLLFPDGRLPGRGFRPVAWLAGGLIAWFTVGSGLGRGPMQGFTGVMNPAGILDAEVPEPLWVVPAGLFVLAVIASGISVAVRVGRAQAEERRQMRWFARASGLVVLVFVAMMVGIAPRALPEAAFVGGVLVALGTVPVAVWIAMKRHGLYGLGS